MKKTRLSLFLIVLLAGSLVLAYAFAKTEGTCGENITWTYDGNGTLVLTGTGSMSDYDYNGAPWDTIKGDIYHVQISEGITYIGENAFLEMVNVESVSLPKTLKAMGFCAFKGCKALTGIDLPEGITSLAQGAFEGTGLISLTIPRTVSYLDAICNFCDSLKKVYIEAYQGSGFVMSSSIFVYCKSLESVSVEDGHLALWDKDGVLYNGTMLVTYPAGRKDQSYIVPDGIETIGRWAFEGAANLMEIKLPESMKLISACAFRDCTGIKRISIPSDMTVIEEKAFSYCENMDGIILPGNMTAIASEMFEGCKNLKFITIPESVTFIGISAFNGCSSLQTIVIPDNVESIEPWAFYNCNSLTSITIPSNIASIGYTAFDECSSLADVYYAGTDKADIQIGTENEYLLNATWHYVNNPTPESTPTPTPTLTPTPTPTTTTKPTPGPDGEVPINEVCFPDSLFRNYVKKNYDSDRNGWINNFERSQVTTVDVDGLGISSLEGIEYFPQLIYLVCNNNKLTELDISQNTVLEHLACYGNQLTSLDVSHNTALNDLACNNNQLTSLNIKRNTKLVNLSCYDNPLNALDVSHNSLLCYLTCNNNLLTSLDVSKNPALKSLSCLDNQLTALDLSQNTALEQLICNNNQIASLDLHNQPDLYLLWCENNQLTSLDISKNPVMAELMVGNNCLTALNTGNNPALKDLTCHENNISSLNLSTNTELETLHCAVNPLITLDVSRNTKLNIIVCSDCELTSLILGKNDVMWSIYAPRNDLSVLDISGCEKLKQLVAETEPGIRADYDPIEQPYGWYSVKTGYKLILDKGVKTITEGNTATPTYTPVPEPEDKVEAFTTRCYSIILDRAPDEGGLKTWYNELTSGRKTASEIIDRFVNSPEFLGKNYSNEEAVDILYQAMLGRNADAAGKANWVKKLESGQTLANVINGFCFSAEFRGLCDSYGIKAGFVNIPNTDTTAEGKIKAFVQRCYRIILDREADPSGMQTWYEQLSSGKKAAAEIIDRFVNSPEFSGKNYSHSDSVEILYKAMLGRGSDAAGKANWVNKLDAGQPFAVVINGFCVSKEFTGICDSYGIKPGSVTVQPLSGMADEEALSKLALNAKEPITRRSETKPNRVEIINPSDTIDMNIGTAVQAVYINEEKAKEFIGRCYRVILGREAGPAELDNWIGQMTNGTKTPDQIARGFLFSNEFKGRNVGNEDLVKILYKVYMNRDADPEGLKTWTEKLNNGTSLNDLLNTFAKTSEFKKVVGEMSK